jgi:hypothetical protein
MSKLERLAKPKHFSLLWKFENYDRKKFYNMGPRADCYSLVDNGWKNQFNLPEKRAYLAMLQMPNKNLKQV